MKKTELKDGYDEWEDQGRKWKKEEKEEIYQSEQQINWNVTYKRQQQQKCTNLPKGRRAYPSGKSGEKTADGEEISSNAYLLLQSGSY